MAGSILIQLKQVRLTLGGAPLFAGVDLSIAQGDRACLVGANGTGKSTLLRLLTGAIAADSGERAVQQGARIAAVAQEPDLTGFPDLRAFAAAPFGRTEAAPDYRAEAELHALHLDPDRPPLGLSGGEIRRASIARALANDPDLLLLDEPTNHLDIAAIEALEQRLLAWRGGLLVISHDRRFLENVSTSCFWLRQGRLLQHPKGFAAFEAWAEAVELEEARTLSRLQTQLKEEERWLARGVTARRSRNEGRRRKLMAMRAEQTARAQAAKSAKADIQAETSGESGRLAIEAKGLSKGWPGQAKLVDGLSFRIMRGDRVGVIGPNGSGKTTLLDLLLRRETPDAGSVRHGPNLEIAYSDQRRALLDPNRTIWETLAPNGGDSAMVRNAPRHVAAYAKDFLFTPAQLRQPVRALSGGERNRLALAVILAQPCNFLVLDEPTNDLDMETLDVLEEALMAFDGTLLLVSHDRAFLDAVTTKIIGATGQGKWAQTPGGYGDFVREHAMPQRPSPAGPTKPPPSVSLPAKAQGRKLSFKIEHRAQELERLLPKAEAEIQAAEARLADPQLFARDHAAFTKLVAQLELLRAEKDRLETEWLEIEEKRGALGT